jgi:hypothetical protein
MERRIQGLVQWDDTGEPLSGALVVVYDTSRVEPLAEGKTNKRGLTELKWPDPYEKERVPEIYVLVYDKESRQLASTREAPLRLETETTTLNLTVPASQRPKRRERPTLQVGPLLLDAKAVTEAKPEIVLDIARAMLDPDYEKQVARRIEALSPDLLPSRHIRRTLCGTDILETIETLIKLKGWPREIALQVDEILRMREFEGFAEQIHECPNFRITYQDSGPAAVNPDTSAQDVIDPGSNPPVTLTPLPAGGAPTYIKRICFWLERALASYTSPPFSMRNPAAGGKIPVVVNSSDFGSASSASGIVLNNALLPDVLCAVAVHELFHMVQFEYSGTGTWRSAMSEGGATWAEDNAAELMNRYLDEAGVNFNIDPTNGIDGGYMTQPHTSLENRFFRYKTSLFWRYVAEQHSPRINLPDEPKIGVETYRQIIEQCEAGSWSSDDIKQALRILPWYQDFYEFVYLDPARLDLSSAETSLGNFALACYLKDLGANIPDRRFEFIEDEENIFIDDVLAPILGNPLQATLASVSLAGIGTVTPTSSTVFSSSVPRFGSRYYEIAVDNAVSTVQVEFSASAGLTSCIIQVILIDQDNAVREIYRTDRTSYTKRFPNLRDGKHLNRVVLVATGAASAGNFNVNVSSSVPAPDVMVTRWHSVMKTEYEIDSYNWAWTWVSPDIWVDNNLDGVADSEVFFNFDNKLHIRLHNKGNLDATGINVEFWYQDASGGLSPTAWLPVQNTAGVTQTLSGLGLPAGASQAWFVDWSPSPSGSSNHFCVRAIVTVPGDPNTDNKRVLSNFGNVRVHPGGFIDIHLLRRNLDPRIPHKIELAMVPRLIPGIEISRRDLSTQLTRLLQPGEVSQDVLRLSYWPVKGGPIHAESESEREKEQPCPCEAPLPQMQNRPDPLGHYPVDPRTLPPGVADMPMLTVVHLVDGVPQGGVTLMVTIEAEG